MVIDAKFEKYFYTYSGLHQDFGFVSTNSCHVEKCQGVNAGKKLAFGSGT